MKLTTTLFVAIIALMLSTGVFVYLYLSLKKENEIKEGQYQSEQLELKQRNAHYIAVAQIMREKIGYYESRSKDTVIMNNIIYKYKIKNEKINNLPDSLQFNYTDTLLAECRAKPFKRN